MKSETREAFENFLRHEKSIREKSISDYVSHIEKIYKAHKGEILEITTYRDFANLLTWIKMDRNWSDRMTYKVASMASVFYNWAFREGLIKESPLRLGHGFKKTETKQVEFFDWDSEDFKKIMTNPYTSIRTRTILHVLRSSGIRASELCALKVKDINNRWLSIKEGKGGRTRQAPIDIQCRNWLDIYLEGIPKEQGFLFLTEDGKRPMNPHGLWKMLYQLGKRLGVKLNPHKFRHSLAGKLISNGADITIAAEVLGHKSLSSTKIYTHFPKKKLLENYDKFLSAS